MGDTIKPKIEEQEEKSAADGTSASTDALLEGIRGELLQMCNSLDHTIDSYRRTADIHQNAGNLMTTAYYHGLADSLVNLRHTLMTLRRRIAEANEVIAW